MTTTLERVRAAVIKAVPEIANKPCTHRLMADENGCPFGRHERDITAADVLRAMPEGIHLTTKGDVIKMVAYDEEGKSLRFGWWYLPLPLHLQSEEALTFLDKTLNHD